MTNSEHPNDDWIGDADYVIPDGSELAEKIISMYPNFDLVFGDYGNIDDVIQTGSVSVPPEITIDDLAAAVAELAELIAGV